ncbi:MAG: winged helix DNA-binding domain-containing protein [Clostridiales Family XIII bacterium]|jgi:hypothetical protein|nr:winged helix DNA-binding domain-containing protein [Clostridiales Family XIII bacterium]
MTLEHIQRRRMHGLYLSRQCPDMVELSRELLGLHCWFHRNVAFSALIRGADIAGWKTALTKTWLYRGTLHGVALEELPTLLALHTFHGYPAWLLSGERTQAIADDVIRYMEDGVYSRAEMRKIFAANYDYEIIGRIFSSWGGIFVFLAQQGKVAFRDMTSRDFDLIDAEPVQTTEEVLPDLLRRYFKAYGPATLDDAAWFFGFRRDDKKLLRNVPLDEYERFELDGKLYFHCGDPGDMGEIPKLTLLSGFDPIIVSYTERGAVLPLEYKSGVILKSGICLPTIAINGKVSGLWNIKKGEPVVEFFEEQPQMTERAAFDLVDYIRFRTAGRI